MTDLHSKPYSTNPHAVSAADSRQYSTPRQAAPNTPTRPNRAIGMVAMYELLKGMGAVVAASIVAMWHTRIERVADTSIASARRAWGQWFAPQLDTLAGWVHGIDGHWRGLVALILGYAALRFLEAYGLYRDRAWAYWLSLLGYGIFLPVEFYDVIAKPFNWLHLCVLLLNALVFWLVFHSMRQKGLI